MINLLFSNEAKLKGLYLRVKSRYCSFRGDEIDLSPELFKTFLILVNNSKEYKRLDKGATIGDIMTEKEKTDVKRINAKFKKTGLIDKPIIISKIRVGYKLNPKVISSYVIKIED